MKLTILSVLCILTSFSRAVASECYHYHTSSKYSAMIAKGKPVLQVRVIDPNGSSIAEERIFSIQLSCKSISIVSTYGEDILLLADDTYYLMSNRPAYDQKEITPLKISEKRNIEQVLQTNILRIKGQWFYFQRNPSSGKLNKTLISTFPGRPVILAHFGNRKFLLKDQKQVWTFELGDKKAVRFPGLNAASVQCFKAGNNDEKYFLTDGNRFYIMDVGVLDKTDITQSLLSLGAKKPFKIKELAINWLNAFADLGDGHIWCYIEAGLGLEDGTNAYLYPLKAKWSGPQHQLISKNGKVYYNGWEAINDFPALNLSQVKQAQSLEITASGLYFDGLQYYNCDYNTQKLSPVNWLNNKARFISGITSYQHGTEAFFDDGQKILTAGPEGTARRIIPHKSPIKNLKLAYAVDDKLLIENKIIPNMAKPESMAYIGSTVDVIQGCDGGRGQVPVVIKYNYFFRDSNAVYVYQSGAKALRKLERLSPDQLKPNDYVQMRSALK
ncbi:hypothetical protein [Pedobacter caeni]|uniref:DKNYY family protein n=1 Tax=Pedobacter caeni TaxID=288992 RepID=A0A1M4W752_9SPHI|nr:hypothetical protein [Pedobacter caeni]SHE77046.1 hypothetical protein SAMN04488522_1011160 [Pedobacter caeni]